MSGQPAGERDDLGPRGDGHEVAHGRGLHALRAAREQPGVALEVARGRPRPAHAAGFAAGARAPWRLVYRHAASGTLARMDFLLDLLQGAGLAAAIGIRPVPAGAARRRARVGRPRPRLRRHRLRVPRGVAVPARRARRSSSALDFVGRRAGRDAADRPPLAVRPAGARAGARRARWPPARSPTARATGGPAPIVGVAGAALGFQAARSLFGRVRRRLDDAGGRSAAGLRGGRWRSPPRASRSSSRRSRCSSSARSSGCSPAAAGARARSTPACASCAERRGGPRSSSSRSSTR